MIGPFERTFYMRLHEKPTVDGIFSNGFICLTTWNSAANTRCNSLSAGVLAKLNDVALRIESITHRDAVE